MNKLCCVLTPRIKCNACGLVWCNSCTQYASDHLLFTGHSVTLTPVTFKVYSNDLTIWKPIEESR